MITFNRNGRLGNFLFQVAACYAYAKKHKMEYCVNPGDYLDLFPHLPVGELSTATAVTYKDPNPHRYIELPYHKDIILEGFWQSYKYFEDCHDEVVDLFIFPKEQKKGVVGIHVRRGDYLQYSQAFPPCPVHYYRKAVKAFTDNGIANFLVFSDDIKWCKQIFTTFEGEFEYRESQTPLQDMHEMSTCEHQIISNSSFSLWAALANRNKHKIVISPSAEFNWFGQLTGLYTLDMLPPSFIQLKF